MSNIRSQIGRDITCKSHSARTERAELYRICPSKLSKRELEDLYFALLENNIELKRTLNEQQDKIKMLSTKVQRVMASQKNALCKETKECCVATRAIIDEQKDSITDLKSANERMAERIRLLNMRLCSAKQFLRRSPPALTARCNRCSTAPATSTSLKNSSMSALNTKRSEGNLKPVASSQYLDKDGCISTRSVDKATQDDEKSKSNGPCDENKCRTLMEELQQKIANLEEELSKTHEEYSNRISRLEREVSEVHKENVLVRSERLASEHEHQQLTKQMNDLVTNLRTTEANCNDLKMQLSIEKMRVAELETQLKVAKQSYEVTKSIEDRFTSITNSTSTQFQLLNNTTSSDQAESKLPKSSEDSGYTETNKSQDLTDDKGLNKLNEELMKKISDLESKLDNLKLSTAAEISNDRRKSKSFDKEQNDLQVDNSCVICEDKFDNITTEPQKNNTTENDNLNTVSGLNAKVIKVIKNNQESPKILVATPCLDVPATNKDIACPDKYDSVSEKEKLQETMTENSATASNDAKSHKQVSHEEYKYQIPGPIPTDKYKKSSIKRPSIEVRTKYSPRKPKKDNDEHNNSTIRNNKEKRYSKPEIKTQNENFGTANDCNKDSEKHADFNDQADKINSPKDVSADLVWTEEQKDTETDERGLRYSINKNSKHSDAMIITDTPPRVEQEAQVDENSPSELYEEHPRKCPCRRRRDVSMFRTCSGTLRFKTTDTTSTKIKACNCKKEHHTKHLYDATKQTGDTQAAPQLEIKERAEERPRSSHVDPGTFSISPKFVKQSRATSPDNTDYEISTMTDLPSEKYEKSPRSVRSPGEEKATTTYTDSYTTPATTDYGSLSEGELPVQTTVRRMALGEKPRTNDAMATQALTTQKMEAALQAIAEELARCKQLIMTQKPREATVSCGREIALRRATASQSIGEARATRCLFKLHMGTIVLSDEAVLFTRNKSLVLMWKFYDQRTAMMRMRTGRVSLFDFTTEYVVDVTDDFLNYMKHEEMPLLICELDKTDEPIATCALPLRDAWSYTNTRADMSLPLVSGPQMQVSRASAAAVSVARDVGVLDLWCMLKTEPTVLPTKNHSTITQVTFTCKPFRYNYILKQYFTSAYHRRGNSSVGER